jgi:penicillin-binding protein 1C
VDALRAEKLDPGQMAVTMPAHLKKIDVCAASGDMPNQFCPVLAPAWFIEGKSPVRESTLHRQVLVDTRSGKIACASGPHTRPEVFEYWPSDMLNLFRRAGMPLRAPPEGECGELASADAGPHIVSPIRGVSHIQRTGRVEPLALKAEAGAGGKLMWFAGDALLGTSRPGEALAWHPPRAGHYILRVVDDKGMADSRTLLVEAAE